MIRPFVLLLALLATGCAGSGSAVSVEGFGYSQRSPILVGGLAERGPASQRAYLDRLRGPGGEHVTYVRIESCCAFSTPNGIMGHGMLDIYEVNYRGLPRPVRLYLNMYDPAPSVLTAPAGFMLDNHRHP